MFPICVMVSCIIGVAFVFGERPEELTCMESRKPYPGDCRLFYKCVALSDAIPSYVWVPSRCPADLAFHPILKKCVLPEIGWNCQHDSQDISQIPYYNEVEVDNEELYNTTTDHALIKLKLTVHDNNRTQQNLKTPEILASGSNEDVLQLTYDSSKSALNAMDQDGVPLSIVNNTSMDQIGNQMHRLTQLINSLKVTSTSATPSSEKEQEKVVPIVYSALSQNPLSHSEPSRNSLYSYPSSDTSQYEKNLLPTQLNKITAQLIMETPTKNKETINVNVIQMTTSKPLHQDFAAGQLINNALIHENTEHLVSALFRKYLTNSNFMSKGEYVKTTPILIPVAVTNKQEPNPKQHNNLIISLSDEPHLPVQNRIPSFSYTHTYYGKSCVNSLRLPNPEDCTRYFLCNSSTASVQSYTCPPNTAFNRFKRICDITEYQRCVKQNNGFLIKEDNVQNTVPCDTEMCTVFKNFEQWRDRPLNCPGNLKYCELRQSCLPVSLCR